MSGAAGDGSVVVGSGIGLSESSACWKAGSKTDLGGRASHRSLCSIRSSEVSCSSPLLNWGMALLQKWFSTFLTPPPFNTVPRAVVTPNHKVIFIAASRLSFCYCYDPVTSESDLRDISHATLVKKGGLTPTKRDRDRFCFSKVKGTEMAP